MRIPQSVIEEIENRARIEDVVGEYVNLTRRGDRLWGLSPFKNEKTPSFTVTPSKNLYYCFSTQQGGGVFQFIMALENLDFPEAVEFLAKKYGIELEKDKADPNLQKRNALYDLYKRVSISLHHLLMEDPRGKNAYEYIQSRGFSEKIISKFNLGYAPGKYEWLYGFLSKRNYSTNFLRDSGLFSKKRSDASIFVNRLMFPIHNLQGDVIAFGGRALEDHGPKYINSPENLIYKKKQNLFGYHLAKDAIRKEKYFIIVEGYLDVMAFHAAGIENVIAPLGTAFTPEQATILKRLSNKALIAFDGDEAGTKATQRTLSILEKENIEAEILEFPDESDPADILLKKGSQAVKNLLEYRSNALEYLIKKAVSGTDISDPGGKQKVLEQLFPYIQGMDSSVKREASYERLAHALGVTPESVISDLRKKKTVSSRKDIEPKIVQQIQSNFELKTLYAVSTHRELFARFRSQIALEDLKHQLARDLFIALEENFRIENSNQEDFLNRIENEVLRNTIIQKDVLEEFNINPELIIDDGIIRIKQQSLLMKQQEIEAQLRNGTSTNLNSLLSDKIYIDKALKDLKVKMHDRSAE